MTAEQIARQLETNPLPVSEARAVLPADEGFYAWWIQPGALPRISGRPHRGGGWELLYVGIAPSRSTSAQRIRSRVLTNHVGGNTGSSTFRFSLAALLFERESWVPVQTRTRYVLSREDNEALRRWQLANTALTWVIEHAPWRDRLEARVIAAMHPPLNLADNAAHPLHSTVSDARRRFRDAAHASTA